MFIIGHRTAYPTPRPAWRRWTVGGLGAPSAGSGGGGGPRGLAYGNDKEKRKPPDWDSYPLVLYELYVKNSRF